MAGGFGLLVFTIMLVFPMATSRLFVAENHSPAVESAGLHERNVTGEFVKGKMSFDEGEWKSDAAPATCTCTCVQGGASPETPSRRSPVERQRSPPPPPAAPYWPPPPSSSDAPSSKSPVSFTSPPPPPATPYGDGPSYEQPSPVVATSPQTFVPSPPPPPPVY